MITQDGFWMQLFKSSKNLKVRVVAYNHLTRKTHTVATVSA